MTDIVLKLNNGTTIPALGLGTWQSPKGEVSAAVEYALKETGIRHIDAAFVYENEQEVGEGIQKAIEAGVVTRDQIFVTTKVFPTYHQRVEESLNESLKNLNLDYVDLLLIHWPLGFNPKGNHYLFPTKEDGSADYDFSFDIVKMWREFERIYKTTKKVRAIGVSNCSIPMLESLLPHVEVVPAANQIELHPYLPQPELVDYCKQRGILIEAYSPLGSVGGPLLKEKGILDLAAKHNAEPASVLISWHLLEGRVVLPKSVNPKRIKSNSVLVPLSKDDLEYLDKLSEKYGIHRYNNPQWGAGILKFPDWQ